MSLYKEQVLKKNTTRINNTINFGLNICTENYVLARYGRFRLSFFKYVADRKYLEPLVFGNSAPTIGNNLAQLQNVYTYLHWPNM